MRHCPWDRPQECQDVRLWGTDSESLLSLAFLTFKIETIVAPSDYCLYSLGSQFLLSLLTTAMSLPS